MTADRSNPTDRGALDRTAPRTELPSVDQIDSVLDAVYRWSEAQGWRGYNKHDGLNSPVLRLLLGWSRWPRMAAVQFVTRAPINVRPLLRIPKTYNPKGIALFVQGLLDRYAATGRSEYLQKAQALLELLRRLRVRHGREGAGWGYAYPWQDPGFYAHTNMPNAVVSSFVCEAFLDAYRVTRDVSYLETVQETLPFFLQALPRLKDDANELCLGYVPVRMTMRVMDVSILVGSVLSQVSEIENNHELQENARRLIRYVVNRQTDDGAWYYTDPPSDSRIRHDNYHTGFILDALWRHMQLGRDKLWMEPYQKGLAFYARNLFNPDGSPRWMSHRDFPHDIHGAAQGILTFSRHQDQYPDLALNIARWAISRMYDRSGRFYYQEMRLYRKKFTLMRWCNAWMARALAHLRLQLYRGTRGGV